MADYSRIHFDAAIIRRTMADQEAKSRFDAQVDYLPRSPRSYRPAIGLIGCGAITEYHLQAYRKANYDVVALCDINRDQAVLRQREFYPGAQVYTSHTELLRRDDIEVVDIATHPPVRPPLVRDALNAGKHVLSQKPFVLDLDVGQELVALADTKGLKLAVNQNGRWAPHFSYTREAVAAGLLGDPCSAHLSVHWDHSWVQGTEFEKVKHLILYDFAIHWFDMLACLFQGRRCTRVSASTTPAPGQPVAPHLMAAATLQYEQAQATLAFDAFTQFGDRDVTYVTGTRGTIHSCGQDLYHQQLVLETKEGVCQPTLSGRWFPDGFHGTMGELLCSIEEDREPTISAATNLDSLALCFAAVASAETGQPVVPGSIRQLIGV